jgi:hypothetical protein
MSESIELARINLEIAEDMELVTVAQILPWLRNRVGGDHRTITGDQVIVWVERAVAAVGRAKRIRSEAVQQ